MTRFDQNFFKTNRQKLAQKTQNGLIVLTAYRQLQRSADTAHPFKQESNFWYLTGINQPDWQTVYDGQRDRCWLVKPELSSVERLFEGEISDEVAMQSSGADEIVPVGQFEELLRQVALKHSTVQTIKAGSQAPSRMVLNPASKDLTQRLDRIFNSVQYCDNEIAQLRAIKQPVEIVAIEKAVKTTVQTFDLVRSKINEYKYEYEIEADFSYSFRKINAQHAYEPIVASDKNACILHYVKNNQKLRKNSFILIDIGAEVANYAADITRTYAYGQLSSRRSSVHQALAAAHQEIIRSIKTDMPVTDYQVMVDKIMAKALIDLRLMAEHSETSLRKYLPHAISHGLGIDVHDPLGRTRTLRPGMVLTVEPGIYIQAENIGIRIEDDILITENGPRNLSQALSTDW